MAWHKFSYGEETYTFQHLEPHMEIFARPAAKGMSEEKYTVDIRYTDHCFTRKPLPGEKYDRALIYPNRERKIRLFCPMRNEMSKLLPGLIRSFPHKKPHHNKDHRNFFTVDNLTYQGQPVKYDIIFNVRKSGKGRLELLVETAYIQDPNYGAAPLLGRRVGFWIILGNTYRGIKIPT